MCGMCIYTYKSILPHAYIVLFAQSGKQASPFPQVIIVFHEQIKTVYETEGGREESQITQLSSARVHTLGKVELLGFH